MTRFNFSPTTHLSLFLNCPRCFWLHVNKGIKRPRGIFPSLPGGMDIVIKKYFDKYRLKDKLPPEIDGKVSGKLLEDLNKLERWRSWKITDLCYEDKALDVSLKGALDDCLVDGQYFIPLDYKTKGSQVKEDPAKYYQNQLDCYCLMLESSGYKTKNEAVLIYYSPKEASENGIFKFDVSPFKIKTDFNSAKSVIKQAVELLLGPMPSRSSECEYCRLIESNEKIK